MSMRKAFSILCPYCGEEKKIIVEFKKCAAEFEINDCDACRKIFAIKKEAVLSVELHKIEGQF